MNYLELNQEIYLNGVTYVCQKGLGCDECHLSGKTECNKVCCDSCVREDGRNVVFIKK